MKVGFFNILILLFDKKMISGKVIGLKEIVIIIRQVLIEGVKRRG